MKLNIVALTLACLAVCAAQEPPPTPDCGNYGPKSLAHALGLPYSRQYSKPPVRNWERDGIRVEVRPGVGFTQVHGYFDTSKFKGTGCQVLGISTRRGATGPIPKDFFFSMYVSDTVCGTPISAPADSVSAAWYMGPC